jgi:prefoldin subunit 5
MQGKKGEEILASVGKGIFVRTKLLSEELTVDVGGKNFVKKNIPDTVKVIRDQIQKLGKAKEGLESQMNELRYELEKTMGENSQN